MRHPEFQGPAHGNGSIREQGGRASLRARGPIKVKALACAPCNLLIQHTHTHSCMLRCLLAQTVPAHQILPCFFPSVAICLSLSLCASCSGVQTDAPAPTQAAQVICALGFCHKIEAGHCVRSLVESEGCPVESGGNK